MADREEAQTDSRFGLGMLLNGALQVFVRFEHTGGIHPGRPGPDRTLSGLVVPLKLQARTGPARKPEGPSLIGLGHPCIKQRLCSRISAVFV